MEYISVEATYPDLKVVCALIIDWQINIKPEKED